MAHCQIFPVVRQITFPSGHRIDVHKVEDGKVWYQVWPVEIERQSVFANLFRKPVDQFDQQVMEHGGTDVVETLD